MFDDIEWSWSRVNGFNSAVEGEGCLHCWSRQYIDGDRGENNFFGEYGTVTHEIAESIFNGTLFEWDVEDIVNKRLKHMIYRAPFTAMKKSYENGLRKFFNEFDQTFGKYKVLLIEEEIHVKVNANRFRGFIDLVAEHPDYGLVVGDMKTSKPYTGTKLENNIMQMYLYSIAVKEKFGKYPENLVFIYPREPLETREHVFKFDEKKLEETKAFLTAAIEKAKNQIDWSPICTDHKSSNEFFPKYLCSHRHTCEHRLEALNNHF